MELFYAEARGKPLKLLYGLYGFYNAICVHLLVFHIPYEPGKALFIEQQRKRAVFKVVYA